MSRHALVLAFSLILVVCAAPTAYAESLTDGLTNYWPLDSNTIFGTSVLDTVGGLTGTESNNPLTVPGVFHEALYFATSSSASSYPRVAFGNVNPIVGNTALTFSVWIKRDPDETGGQFLTKWNDTGAQYSFIFQSNSGNDDNIFVAFKGSTNNFLTGNSTGGAATRGTWHLITVTWSTAAAATINIYVDTVLQSMSYSNHSSLVSIASATSNVYMGVRDNGAAGIGAPYDGSLDDMRIYNRVLTSAEITRLYNTNTARVIRLIGHIRLRGVRLR